VAVPLRRAWYHQILTPSAEGSFAEWTRAQIFGLSCSRFVVERTRLSLTAYNSAVDLGISYYPQGQSGDVGSLWVAVEFAANLSGETNTPPRWPFLEQPSDPDRFQPTVVAALNPVLQRRELSADDTHQYDAWVAHLPTEQGDSKGQRSFTAAGGDEWAGFTVCVQAAEEDLYSTGGGSDGVPFVAHGLVSALISCW